MRLDAMTFRQTEEGAVPDAITVTMTAREALWLAEMNGRLSDLQIAEILPGFEVESAAIYSCLAYEVAAGFPEGLDDMKRVVTEES